MTAADGRAAQAEIPARKDGALMRWLQRRRAARRRIDYAVWDLRERYGEAAYGIACASARAPAGYERRRFWRKVALKLRQFG